MTTPPAPPPAVQTREPLCPFCGRDPFHYVDNGVGMEAVAVTCCNLGDAFFRGMREPHETVTMDWGDFFEIGNKLSRIPTPAERPAERPGDAALAEAIEWLAALAKNERDDDASRIFPVSAIEHMDRIVNAYRSGALSPAPRDGGWNAAIEAAAKVARFGCLVPPDGGSPTQAEVDMCVDIGLRISALSRPLPAPPTEDAR